MKAKQSSQPTQMHLNEQESTEALGLLEEDQRELLRNNKESLAFFLGSLNQLKEQGLKAFLGPSVVQTAFFLAVGGKE
jgi:hypothetical protein